MFDQFSSASSYNIQINYQTSDSFDIDFSPQIVCNQLCKINVNKAMGPDKIPEHVLKNCCNILATPLSILFTLSYYTSKIPSDWKSALVVPVHKKGSKENIEN